VERVGSAVELRPAPKARSPQERQHSAAEGGTWDRVSPGRSSPCAARAPPCVRDRHPKGGDAGGDGGNYGGSARLRAPRASGPARMGRTKKFAVLNTVLISAQRK
jgi:hypothetical protein